MNHCEGGRDKQHNIWMQHKDNCCSRNKNLLEMEVNKTWWRYWPLADSSAWYQGEESRKCMFNSAAHALPDYQGAHTVKAHNAYGYKPERRAYPPAQDYLFPHSTSFSSNCLFYLYQTMPGSSTLFQTPLSTHHAPHPTAPMPVPLPWNVLLAHCK